MKLSFARVAGIVLASLMGLALASGGWAKEYGDVVLKKNAAGMAESNVKPVVFPHWFHRIRYKCKVCHEDIFVMKAGANDINMNAIMEGKSCGACHNGTVAWEPMYCDRCHNDDTPPAASAAMPPAVK